IEKFYSSVEKYSSSIAIYDDETKYTYKELKIIVNKVANELKQNGIELNQCVPLIMKPSTNLIIVILALYQIGAYYLPIAHSFPKKRKLLFLKDSNSDCYISDEEELKTNKKYINVMKLINKAKNNNHIATHSKIKEGKYAYRIYTSGSTGAPKGVLVTQDNLRYILTNMNKYFPCNRGDKYILTTPYTFDVSITEIFGWIYGGGSLYVSSKVSSKALTELPKMVIDNNITHLALSPSILNMILSTCRYEYLEMMDKTLKYIMIAGEELIPELANKLNSIFKSAKTFNLYGPTEATVYATYYEMNK
ncbi:AMP-binding protein, partial [Weizmannia acidilactici]|uniref:AMP-binding protein n=2 Tax=Weizmannia acidilactici TaxID=2607726 RepID=UPI001561F306